jgi:molecular chaperone DnaJ
LPADYYELLGVDRNASQDDIKRAYRRLARELHPDTGHGSPESEARFKEVTRAYEVLRDPEKRQRYDTFGAEGVGANGSGAGADPFGFGNIGDVFEAFFGGSPFGGRSRGPSGPPRGSDLEEVAELTFEEAVFGCQKSVMVRTAVPCTTCQATGTASGTAPATCPECRGTGQVQRVRQSLIGQMVTSTPCPRCGGAGQVITDPCRECRGHGLVMAEAAVPVTIPPGVDSNMEFIVEGEGHAGGPGVQRGDLRVQITVRKHPLFERHGDDLVCQAFITFPQAALGCAIEIPTVDGQRITHTLPRGVQSHEVVTIPGKGMPNVRGRRRGNLHVQVVVETPKALTKRQEELLRELAELDDQHVSPQRKGWLDRIKAFFADARK